MFPADSSPMRGPTVWSSWPGKCGCGEGAFPWLSTTSGGRRQGLPSPPTVVRWYGPQALCLQKVGQGPGPTGELKIKPVCFCSLSGSLGGHREQMSCGPCLGDILLYFAPRGQ